MILNLRSFNKVVEIPIIQIRPCRTQTRRYYNAEKLRELAASIRNNGVLQPVIVRKVTSSEYELIAGERRLRACVMCGKARIPCIIISCSDDEAKVYSLEENIRRSDLHFIEEAQSVSSFIFSENISRQEAAEQLGKDPDEISDMLDILKFDDCERELILRHHLTLRHAKALMKIEDKTERRMVLSEIIENSMNVSQTENYIKYILTRTGEEKRRMQRQKGVIRDIRLFENTIKKAVIALNTSGIDARTILTEDEDQVEYTIRIPKERTLQNAMSA